MSGAVPPSSTYSFVLCAANMLLFCLCEGDGLCSAPADAKYNRVSQQDEREGKSVSLRPPSADMAVMSWFGRLHHIYCVFVGK